VNQRHEVSAPAAGTESAPRRLGFEATRIPGIREDIAEKAALVDLAHDSIMVLDPVEERIRYWNPGATALYGYTAAEALGRIASQLLKTVGVKPFAGLLQVATISDKWDGELRHTTKAGKELVVESRWAILRDSAGEMSGIMEINRDITARLRGETELREANEALELRVQEIQERTAELEAFTYTVSHDLRTPLRAVIGFVNVLYEDFPDDLGAEARDSLDEIRDNAIRMGHLIDDLLAFSRLGTQDLRKRDVDMELLARRASHTLDHQTEGRSLELEFKPMPHAMGEASLLEQVWSNLLANAIKFTGGRQPARITAGFEIHAGRPAYFVRDNGVGFDMKHASQLFGVFQRLHAIDEFEGTGVGLATVMRICTRHGGTVWAEAAPDLGATFYFTLGGSNE
jgi:PAS domain S-box-containing protein